MSVGPTELIIVLVIALVIFGPKRLPALGRSLGSGMREFKNSIGGLTGDDDDQDADAKEIDSRDATSDAKSDKPAGAPAAAGQRDAD